MVDSIYERPDLSTRIERCAVRHAGRLFIADGNQDPQRLLVVLVAKAPV